MGKTSLYVGQQERFDRKRVDCKKRVIESVSHKESMFHIVKKRIRYGVIMAKSIKTSIAKATSSNMELNKKALHMHKSWKEVEGILNSIGKHTKK